LVLVTSTAVVGYGNYVGMAKLPWLDAIASANSSAWANFGGQKFARGNRHISPLRYAMRRSLC